MEALKIYTSFEDRMRVLSLTGEIDLQTVSSLIQSLQRATDTGDRVMVDMAGVRYIDSQGVRALRNAHQQAVVTGGTLQLRGCQGMVDRILRTVGLDRIIEMESDSPLLNSSSTE